MLSNMPCSCQLCIANESIVHAIPKGGGDTHFGKLPKGACELIKSQHWHCGVVCSPCSRMCSPVLCDACYAIFLQAPCNCMCQLSYHVSYLVHHITICHHITSHHITSHPTTSEQSGAFPSDSPKLAMLKRFFAMFETLFVSSLLKGQLQFGHVP